jgi:polyhydroxyalkanoate synthesis repressor PhaR
METPETDATRTAPTAAQAPQASPGAPTAASAAAEGAVARRVIKRYSNRKLYDTRDSRYVTLQQIGEMVRAGEEVQIIDNATKEDKTEVTLALILSEDLRAQPRSVPLAALRDLIQERGGRLLNQLPAPIRRLMPGAEVDEGGDEAPVDDVAPPAPPEPVVAAAPAPVPDERPSRSRFSEMLETSKHAIEEWQHSVDERVRAVLPGAGLRELQAEVQALGKRVAELEATLARLTGAAPPSSSQPARRDDAE